MIYCFDLDGTLCESVIDGNYRNAQPFIKAIDKVNSLFDAGNTILIFTGRGSSSGIDWTDVTKHQLQTWGLRHHKLIMNVKPTYDIVIDDKAVNALEWRLRNCGVRGVLAGAFDLIHPGYCRMFKLAKQNCDHLTVLLHDDPSIERNKMKPVHTLAERIEILSSIKYIDEIKTYKTENDLYDMLKVGEYDIRFIGDDYREKSYTADNLNISVMFVPRSHGYSTTELKKKITETFTDWKLNND